MSLQPEVEMPSDRELGFTVSLPIELQLEEIARCWHKMMQLGLKPERPLWVVAREEFGVGEGEINRINNRALNFLNRAGVPTIEEELSSPCHARSR